MTVENYGNWIDGKEKVINETSESLRNLELQISSNMTNNESKDYKETLDHKILQISNLLWIDENIAREYLNIVNKVNMSWNDIIDKSSKDELWFDGIEQEISYNRWYIIFYIKKYAPNKFREISITLLNFFTYLDYQEMKEEDIYRMKRVISSIRSYWDSTYEYIKFCSPFDGSYIKKWVSHMQGKNFWETIDQMIQREEETRKSKKKFSGSLTTQDLIEYFQGELWNISMMNQYLENFTDQQESINLFSFIKENPQKLENLWWKLIKSINLDMNSWINFAFRWIIQMVKSRPDLNFPDLKQWATHEEKQEWKQQREMIIKEYESMLRNFIGKDKVEKQWGTFDKIFFTMSHDPKDDQFMPDRARAQQFWDKISDYSVDRDKITDDNNREASSRMLSDIEQYSKEHPNENILVCVNHHGQPNWSSWNWREKEDRIRLANISPNIKIRTIRCYFWDAYENDVIYNHLSPISWFSNITPAWSNLTEIISEASSKNLWFHEMEIYTRLNYPVSVTPLTEKMEYINNETWNNTIWNIWLAQNSFDWDKADPIHNA